MNNTYYIINGRFLTQNLTGVHRYAYEICCALHYLNFNFIVVAPKEIKSSYKCPFTVVKTGRTRSHLWEQIELPLYVKKHYKGAVLINLTGIGSLIHNNIVTTIHDLSFLENPKWFSKSYYLLYKFLTPRVAKKAKKIITVSNFSKKEIIDKLGIKQEKISVIYNAVSDKLVLNDTSQREKVILSVSSLEPRKNFGKLLEAFNKLVNSDYKLIIVGKQNKVFGAVNLSDTNENIEFTGYISDEELTALYHKACAFVYPSLYEGFGIPNLEAMNNGCPVITSDIPAHKEVCGEAAIYFSPLNADDLLIKMQQLINDDRKIKEMVNKGYERAKFFSWEKSAKQLITVLETTFPNK